MRRRSYSGGGYTPIGCVVIIALLVVAFIVAGIGFGIYRENHVETITCSVTDKDRTVDSDGDSHPRVYTTECGVLTVTDDFWRGEFNSADTYGSIQRGHRYEFTTVGIRVGFFSWFPNIITVKEVGA